MARLQITAAFSLMRVRRPLDVCVRSSKEDRGTSERTLMRFWNWSVVRVLRSGEVSEEEDVVAMTLLMLVLWRRRLKDAGDSLERRQDDAKWWRVPMTRVADDTFWLSKI